MALKTAMTYTVIMHTSASEKNETITNGTSASGMYNV